MSLTTAVGCPAEWRAVCIERCKHGSGGGAEASSKEASRVYPTETRRGSVELGEEAQAQPGHDEPSAIERGPAPRRDA